MNLNTKCIFFLNQPKQILSTFASLSSLNDKLSLDSSRTHFQMSHRISGQPSRRLVVSNAASSSPSLSGGFPGTHKRIVTFFLLALVHELPLIVQISIDESL